MPIEFTAVEVNHWGVRWVRVGATLRTLELVEASQTPLDPLPEVIDTEAPEDSPEAAAEDGQATQEVAEGDEAAAPEAVPASARPDDDGLAPWSEIERRQIATLKRLVAESRIPQEFIITSIPGTAVTARLATFPFDKRSKIEQVLKAEVDSRLPYDIDDVLTDFIPVGKLAQTEPQGQEEDTSTSVLVFAAFKGAVGRTLRLFRAAGIELRQIDALPVALSALPGTVSTEGAHIRVFLGEKETVATVLNGGKPLFVRTIPVGFLASVLRWDTSDENRQRYIGLLEDPSLPMQEGEPLPDHESFAARIRKDLSVAIRAFEAQFSIPITSAVWFGPGSRDQLLVQKISGGLPVPSAELIPDTETLGALGFPYDRPASLWSTVHAMVLRLAKPDRQPVSINLRREEFSYRSRFRDLGEKLLPATYFLVAAVLLYVISTMVEIRSLQEKLADARVRVAEAYRNSTGKTTENYAEASGQLQAELAVKERLLQVMSEISGVSILNHLAEISRSIKTEVTIDTDSLSIERDRVIIDARTADYNALGQIEGYFSKHPFYKKVEVRNTRRLPDGKVGFRMELYVSSEEDQAKALEAQQKESAAGEAAPASGTEDPGSTATEVPAEEPPPAETAPPPAQPSAPAGPPPETPPPSITADPEPTPPVSAPEAGAGNQDKTVDESGMTASERRKARREQRKKERELRRQQRELEKQQEGGN